ncbi:fumarylacetoacetate hydrolase family protein [Amycolatopsis sp. NPDC059027]|uniref:fumarylacetoacetate hydrolase family protein n=1 Tax=unclassified Amycolatopsis TaxID=2618356 RepID=UPI00366E902B
MLVTARETLPEDAWRATLVGRVHDPGQGGPCVVAVRGDELADLTPVTPTLADLTESADPVALARTAPAARSWPLADVLAASFATVPSEAVPRLLAPADLQVLKAAGVTFAGSLTERVIEEKTGGDPARAAAVRAEVERAIGGTLSTVVPGSPEAAAAKEWLRREGLWSQYLEVGIGPEPEVFTKAPLLAAVGHGARIGVAAVSAWNNPEPEVVLAVTAAGRIVGATLGNDVNLRDIEGRSALLLPKAKDNNASAALGPFLRLFDDHFGMADVRTAELRLRVAGEDGFVLDGASSMRYISRDPLELVASVIGPHHQYPDGFLLYTGTLFAPTEDRDTPGGGFTHHLGDVVRIACPALGTLVNTVTHAETAEPWTFGVRALMANLARRGLLPG